MFKYIGKLTDSLSTESSKRAISLIATLCFVAEVIANICGANISSEIIWATIALIGSMQGLTVIKPKNSE